MEIFLVLRTHSTLTSNLPTRKLLNIFIKPFLFQEINLSDLKFMSAFEKYKKSKLEEKLFCEFFL